MIDDSIKLTDTKSGDNSQVVTDMGVFPPPCPLLDVFGGEDIWRDIPMCVGSRFFTSDKLMRYKLLEHSPEHIIEHFVVRDDAWSYPLWTTKVDRRTLRTEKFYNLKAIFKVHCLLGGNGIPLEMFARRVFKRSPYFASEYEKLFERWLPKYRSIVPLNSSDDYIMSMLSLYLNVEMMDGLLDEGNELDVDTGVIFHGIKPYWKNVVVPTASGRILSSIERFSDNDLKEFMHPLSKFSPMSLYKPNNRDRQDDIEADLQSNAHFDVLKYAELIPYGEFHIRKRADQPAKLHVHDPYNRPRQFEVDFADDEAIKTSIDKIEEILLGLTGSNDWLLYRSWDEEVYITLRPKVNDPKFKPRTRRFYFDLMYAAIGSRMLSSEFFI
jgi:hypothetical protein